MAIFDVKCEHHGAFEVLVEKYEDLCCPECGGKVERIWSNADAPRFELRSGGFFCTDYGKGPERLH